MTIYRRYFCLIRPRYLHVCLALLDYISPFPVVYIGGTPVKRVPVKRKSDFREFRSSDVIYLHSLSLLCHSFATNILLNDPERWDRLQWTRTTSARVGVPGEAERTPAAQRLAGDAADAYAPLTNSRNSRPPGAVRKQTPRNSGRAFPGGCALRSATGVSPGSAGMQRLQRGRARPIIAHRSRCGLNRPSARHEIHRQPAQRRFLILGPHVVAGLAHRLDDSIQ